MMVAGPEAHGDHMVGVEAGRDLLQADEAADEESGADEEH
jgi:hypothetical protein